MANCVYCDTSIDEEYNFCLECEKQVKCVECEAYLVKDKVKCFKCGTALSIVSEQQSPMNTFTLEEHQTRSSYSRKVNLAFTNEAIEKAAPFLSGYTPVGQLNKKDHNKTEKLGIDLSVNQSNHEPQDTTYSIEEDGIKGEPEVISAKKAPFDALNYFEKDNKGFLITLNPDFKGDNKKEQQQRFFIMYIWAYSKMFDSVVPNIEHLTNAAKANSIYDTNFRRTFDQIAVGNIVQTDGTLKLSPSGNVYAHKVLAQIGDENLKGFDYSVVKKGAPKGPRLDSKVKSQLEDWVKKESRFNSFDIRKADSQLKLCIVAYFDLISELKVLKDVPINLAYEFLLKKYKSINIDKKSFGRVLTRVSNKKYFLKASGGGYFVTEEADKIAEGMLTNS